MKKSFLSLLAVVLLIGTAAYNPIKDETDEL